MSGDAYYPNVSLLLHCDGTDGSTTFTDSSPTPKTVTASGNAHIETDQAKFGTASAYFDGTGDYCQIANNAALNNFGTDDFTIECWARFSNTGSYYTLLSCWTTWNTSAAYELLATNTGRIVFFGGDSVPINIQSNINTAITNTWIHIAACRASGTTRLFVGGSSVGTPHVGSVSISNGAALKIGASSDGSAGHNGYLDDIRITKGAARYTADFTPPTVAFPNFAGQIAGVITDDASDPVARVVRAYRRDTGALVGNTTSSAGDGSYSINLPTLDECSVIALDDASGDLFNDLIARVTPA